jgi:hypothetical protein
MRRTELMTAGGVTLAGLGALVGLAIGSGERPKLTAPRAQPVEVRTEIIRKTVNVYRREHPHHAAGTGPASGSSSGASATGARAAASISARTRASGTAAVAPRSSATPVVTTRSSGSKGGGSGSSRPVSTRSSGGEDGHSGGRDD